MDRSQESKFRFILPKPDTRPGTSQMSSAQPSMSGRNVSIMPGTSASSADQRATKQSDMLLKKREVSAEYRAAREKEREQLLKKYQDRYGVPYICDKPTKSEEDYRRLMTGNSLWETIKSLFKGGTSTEQLMLTYIMSPGFSGTKMSPEESEAFEAVKNKIREFNSKKEQLLKRFKRRIKNALSSEVSKETRDDELRSLKRMLEAEPSTSESAPTSKRQKTGMDHPCLEGVTPVETGSTLSAANALLALAEQGSEGASSTDQPTKY